MTNAFSLRIGRPRERGHEDSIFCHFFLLTYDVTQSTAAACTKERAMLEENHGIWGAGMGGWLGRKKGSKAKL